LPTHAADTAAASSKEKPRGNININIDPQISKLDEPYKDAIKNLSKEQLEKLEAQDKEYAKTTAIAVNTVSAGLEVKHCVEQAGTVIAQNPQKYQAELGVLRVKSWAEQHDARRVLEPKLAAEVAAFMDPKILSAHHAFGDRMMMAIGSQMMEASFKMGGFKKTDCAVVAQKLDDAFAAAAVPGRGADTIPPEKLAEIQRAAETGSPDAVMTLGMLHLKGEGVPRDREKGVVLVTQAAEKGYGRAQLILGLIHGTDMFGGVRDMEKAKFWLGKAAAQGNERAAMLLRNIDAQPPSETLQQLAKKAEAGDARAQYDLAGRYRDGSQGAEKDPAQSMKWFLMSAGQGFPLAESDLGILMLNGTNRTAEALGWMTLAARHGVPNSQYELANIYLAGQLVPKDMDRARFWFKAAADKGESRSIEMLKKLPSTQ
jgi:TPR repeat protein